MKIVITEDFDSPRYGRLTAGQEVEVAQADAAGFIRDGRAGDPEAAAAEDAEPVPVAKSRKKQPLP